MGETRKLAAILCSDVVGYSRLAVTDEDRILARMRALRSDLIDKSIAAPIRVYSVEVGKPAQARPREKRLGPKRRSALALLAAGFALLLVLIAGGVWYLLGANRPAPVASNAPPLLAGAAFFPRGAALRQSQRRSGAGLPRRRPDR